MILLSQMELSDIFLAIVGDGAGQETLFDWIIQYLKLPTPIKGADP